MHNTQRLVYFSLLTTMAAALGLLETILPNPFPLPGIKLGLANIVTLLVIYVFGLKEGLIISVLRVLFVSFLSGTFMSVAFFLSLSGGILSALVMALFKIYVPALSIIGISIVGAVSHNIGQLLTASFLIQTSYIFFYLPVLLLAALPTGLSTGYIARLLLPYLQDRFI